MFQLMKQWVDKQLGEWKQLESVRQLSRLNDHQLEDIGLRRDQLFMLTWEPEPSRDEIDAPRREPAHRLGFEPCG
jgi:hypothetical protein